MSQTITDADVTIFTDEVHHEYQRFGPVLRQMVTLKDARGGKTVQFNRLGARSANRRGARHADVTTLNFPHNHVNAVMDDYEAFEYADRLDEVKNNINERQAYAQATAMALGRRYDDVIIDTLDSGVIATVPAAATNMTFAKVTAARRYLQENNVITAQSNQLFGLLPPSAEEFLLNNEEKFINKDFISLPPIANVPMQYQWLGIRWLTWSALPFDIATSTRSAFIWRQDAVGIGENYAPTMGMDWVPQKRSTLIGGEMSLGGTLIHANGVVEIECTETPVNIS